MYLNDLPAELIIEVAENLLLASDILCLSLTCKNYYIVLLPLLYKKVDLKSLRQCCITLQAMKNDALRSRHVQKLRIRPNYLLRIGLVTDSKDQHIDGFSEKSICRILCSMAEKGRLTSLRELDWDGMRAPEDQTWLNLRNNCESLKALTVTVGLEDINPSSQLFGFEGLRLFTLRMRRDVKETLPVARAVDLPDQMWSMLLLRCPDLEHLHLSSFIPSSYYLFNFDPVFHGTWPCLRSLTLGCFIRAPGVTVHASSVTEGNENAHPDLNVRSPTYYCESFFSR